MANYRLPQIDLSTRIALALRMLDPTRSWGEATALALQYGVSRKFLYTLAARAAQGLRNALTPQPPGPKPEANILVMDDEALR